jgi:hypothetical protein
MGTKGSFAIAQLTDLLFLEFQLQELYPKEEHTYFMKVGDDTVVHDPLFLLKDVYESIGVPINTSKCKFTTCHGTFTEFVSRNSWNNLDYSIISPNLVAKFLRNDFYLSTLFHHVKQRSTNSPSISQILDMKRDLISSRKNFSLEKFEDRKKNLMKIISLFQKAFQVDLLDTTEIANISQDELLLIMRNIVLATLAEYVIQTENLLKDEKGNLSNAKVETLVGELKAVPEIDYYQGSKDFFAKVNHLGLPFKEVVSLWLALPTVVSVRRDYTRGVKNITNVPTYEPFLEKVNGDLIANAEFLYFYINLATAIKDQAQSHMNLRKGPNFERMGTSKVLDSHRFLNAVIKSREPILDLKTFELTNPKGLKVALNPDLVRGYAQLLKVDIVLERLDNLSLSHFNITLFPEPSNCFEGDESRPSSSEEDVKP